MKRRCAWCGTGFAWEGVGRPPKYCRRSHRQRHYEARKEADRLGIEGVLIGEAAWRRLGDAAFVLESGLADARQDLADGEADVAARDLMAAAEALLAAMPEPEASR